MWTTLLAGTGVATAAWLSVRYAWWRPAVDWKSPRVLMYHMVSPHRRGARFNKLRVPPEEFARQVGWLNEQGFRFVFASELVGSEAVPERSVCLTFDDGYEDNLTQADPVLAEFGAKATLYLVADRTGGWSSKKKAHHADDELANEPKLSDEQVRKMLASGRWELGGHTTSHANLAAIDSAEANQEIAESRDLFEKAYGVDSPTFAYPFGIYKPEHVELVRAAGYSAAVTTEAEIAAYPYVAPFEIPRVKVSGKDSLLDFKLRMRGGRRGLRS